MCSSSVHLKALGDLLRARRGRVGPETLPERYVVPDGRRRVPGLRREEVARAAAVSTDYYTRVEQGRLAPTGQVLAALCRVLGLTSDDTAYAEDLLSRARGGRPSEPGRVEADGRLRLVLNQLNELPAMVMGPRMSILEWNPLAAALITDFSRIPVAERTYIGIIFTDPRMRSLYQDWPAVARTCVGVLRREAARNPGDPDLAALVGRLSIASPEFRRWWAEHLVAEQDFGQKTIDHPLVGRVRLNWDSFTYSGAPDQQLVLWTPEPGSPDQQALARLAAACRPAAGVDGDEAPGSGRAGLGCP